MATIQFLFSAERRFAIEAINTYFWNNKNISDEWRQTVERIAEDIRTGVNPVNFHNEENFESFFDKVLYQHLWQYKPPVNSQDVIALNGLSYHNRGKLIKGFKLGLP